MRPPPKDPLRHGHSVRTAILIKLIWSSGWPRKTLVIFWTIDPSQMIIQHVSLFWDYRKKKETAWDKKHKSPATCILNFGTVKKKKHKIKNIIDHLICIFIFGTKESQILTKIISFSTEHHEIAKILSLQFFQGFLPSFFAATLNTACSFRRRRIQEKHKKNSHIISLYSPHRSQVLTNSPHRFLLLRVSRKSSFDNLKFRKPVTFPNHILSPENKIENKGNLPLIPLNF
jgi:hypothetical protein